MSKPFSICPFCQAASPISEPRCVRCRRSLAGLRLPVYGAELDTPLRHAHATPLQDLPLRGSDADPASASLPPPPPVTRGTDRRAARPPSARPRARARAATAVAALAATVLVGGFLVRAHERGVTRSSEPAPAATARPVSVPPPSTRPVTSPVTARPPATRPSAVAREASVTPRPPSRRPAGRVEVRTVYPDVRGLPVDVERAREDSRRPRPAEGDEDDSRARLEEAALRVQLRRAEAERDRLAGRVDALRARASVPVITDVEEHQRVQAALAAALDQLDEMDAEVARLRRALDGGET